MTALYIEESLNTPEVKWDPEASSFSMSGKSFPENARKFYEPVMAWLKECDINELNGAQIDCYLEYVSSSSVIALLEVLRAFEGRLGSDNMKVRWRYDIDDDDMLKVGKDYSMLLGIDFEYTSVAE